MLLFSAGRGHSCRGQPNRWEFYVAPFHIFIYPKYHYTFIFNNLLSLNDYLKFSKLVAWNNLSTKRENYLLQGPLFK